MLAHRGDRGPLLDEGHARHRGDGRDDGERRRPTRLVGRDHDHPADHDVVALSEVVDPGDVRDQHEAERHEREHASARQTREDVLRKVAQFRDGEDQGESLFRVARGPKRPGAWADYPDAPTGPRRTAPESLCTTPSSPGGHQLGAREPARPRTRPRARAAHVTAPGVWTFRRSGDASGRWPRAALVPSQSVTRTGQATEEITMEDSPVRFGLWYDFRNPEQWPRRSRRSTRRRSTRSRGPRSSGTGRSG